METGVHVTTLGHLTFRIAAPMVFGALLTAATPSTARADDKAECIAASEKAQQLRDDRKFLKAREQLLVCGRDVCPGPVKKDCADQLTQIDARTPSIVVRAKGKHGEDLVSVKVTSDGVLLTDKLDGRAISLDPGEHALHFELEGAPPTDQHLVIAEGEHNRVVTVSFGPAAVSSVGGGAEPVQKKGPPVGAFVLGGLGVVAAGVVAPIFYVMGLDQKSADEAPTGCKNTQPGGCSQGEIDSIRTKLVVGDVFMGVGVAAVIGGVVWAVVHYTSGSKETATPAAAAFDVAPTAYGRGAVASATLRF
jgi:hypothetical protein